MGSVGSSAAVHALAELGEDGVRGGAVHPVDPVVQDDHPLLVVGEGLLGVLDDERGVQAAVLLDAGVRVEPVRPRGGDGELVREGPARGDVPLGQPRDPVHVVAQCEAVPVQGGGLGEVVGQGEGERAARGGPDLLARQLVPVRPGADGDAGAEVERGGGGGHLDLGERAGGLAGGLGGLDLGSGRVHVPLGHVGGGTAVVHRAVAAGGTCGTAGPGGSGAGGEQPGAEDGRGRADDGAAGGKRAHGSTSWVWCHGYMGTVRRHPGACAGMRGRRLRRPIPAGPPAG